MGFIPIPWNIGDKITKSRLDRIEQGVADADVTNPASPAAAALGATYLTLAQWSGNVTVATDPDGATVLVIDNSVPGASLTTDPDGMPVLLIGA